MKGRRRRNTKRPITRNRNFTQNNTKDPVDEIFEHHVQYDPQLEWWNGRASYKKRYHFSILSLRLFVPLLSLRIPQSFRPNMARIRPICNHSGIGVPPESKWINMYLPRFDLLQILQTTRPKTFTVELNVVSLNKKHTPLSPIILNSITNWLTLFNRENKGSCNVVQR